MFFFTKGTDEISNNAPPVTLNQIKLLLREFCDNDISRTITTTEPARTTN